MALTRKLLSAMGIEADKIEQIIDAHSETVDALKKERDSFKEKAEGYDKAKSELESLKESAKNGGDYEKLKKEFEDYKADIQKKETLALKKEALKKIAKDADLNEAGIAKALKYSDFEAIELDEKGEIKDSKALLKSLKEEWADYVQTTRPKGAETPTPPNNNGGKAVKTKEEILAIKDTAERQAAWRDYLDSKKGN